MNRRTVLTTLVVLCVLVSATGAGLVWDRLGRRTFNQAWSGDAHRAAPGPILGEDQREYLWQVEHHGLLLSRHGFSRLAQTLRRNEPAAFLALLADGDGFEGRILDQPRETRVDTGYLRVLRQRNSEHGPVKLDRQRFVSRLFEDRARFTKSPQVKLALMALAPTDPHNLDGPWEGTCQLRMWGEMGSKKPGEVVLYLRYQVPRPTEELLKGNGWLRSCTLTQRQVSEASRFLMREAAAERGIETEKLHDNWKQGTKREAVSGGAFLCDYNRDGCLDLLLTDLSGNALYEGKPGGGFINVTTKVGLPRLPSPVGPVAVGAAVVDLDNDGWEDVILGSSVYRNDEGRSFRSRAPISGLNLSSQNSAIIADYDRDGLPDLYVTALGQTKAASWVGGEGSSVSGNALWHNEGNWHFTNVTQSSGTAGGGRSTFSAVWFDADENGWPDLYVINEFGSGVLLVNQGDGTFRERMIDREPGDFGSMGITSGDYDNDGHIDLYAGNMYSKAGNRVIGNLWPGTYPEPTLAKLRSLTVGSQMHRNLGGLKFEHLGQELQIADVGWSYGPAMVDLNNDGWLDIYATCGYMSQSRDDPDG